MTYIAITSTLTAVFSIDDHEVYNLRLMLNEIFGEENLIQQLV